MTGAHLHLLVNHVPILGSFFALALLVASLWYAPDVLRRVALVLLVIVGMAAAAANYTGEPAEDAIRQFPGVFREVIHEHEEFAELAFYAAVALGLISLGALVRWRQEPMPHRASMGVLAGAAVVSGMMAYTGLLGGQVRHTEVRPDAAPGDALMIESRRSAEADDKED